jgi:hypothetical protein
MDVLPDFALSEQKLRVGTWIADKLNTSMKQAAEHYQWTFVDGHRRDFVGRGICAGTTYDGADIADDLRLPRKNEQGWRPYNPADFKAYASRQRWFRTPNDAFMTGNFHVAASLLQKVLKLDAFAWSAIGIAVADAVAGRPVTVEKVRDGSPAARIGLARGDTILAVGGREIANRDEFRRRCATVRNKNSVLLTVGRGRRLYRVTVPLDRRA